MCDYRQLNANTVPDNFALPHVDDILADCAKGKIWATIDMTDSFFQTRMHPDDIHKTAVTTPFGNYNEMVALSQSQRLESIYVSSEGTQTHTHTIQNQQSTKFYSEVRAS